MPGTDCITTAIPCHSLCCLCLEFGLGPRSKPNPSIAWEIPLFVLVLYRHPRASFRCKWSCRRVYKKLRAPSPPLAWSTPAPRRYKANAFPGLQSHSSAIFCRQTKLYLLPLPTRERAPVLYSQPLTLTTRQRLDSSPQIPRRRIATTCHLELHSCPLEDEKPGDKALYPPGQHLAHQQHPHPDQKGIQLQHSR